MARANARRNLERRVPETQHLRWAETFVRSGLLLLVGCGPVVEADRIAASADNTTSSSPSATSSSDTTDDPRTVCTVGSTQECDCPGGRVGTQVCLPSGEFDGCSCLAPTGTGGPATSGSTSGSGASTDTAASSSGDPQPISCPEIPAPCSGVVAVASDPGLLDVSMCTSLDGSLTLSGTVSDISSLGCMTVLGELRIESTELPDLSGLSRLAQLGTLEIEAAPEVTRIGLSGLEQLGRLSLTGNSVLEQLDFAELTEISGSVHVTENPNLPHCEVEGLLGQVGGAGGEVCYESNQNDTCLPFCL